MSGLTNLKKQGFEYFSFKEIKPNINITNNKTKFKKKSNSIKCNTEINYNQQQNLSFNLKKMRKNRSNLSKLENEKTNDKLYLRNIQLKTKLNKVEKDLILAKSANHKKDRELLEKKKLISTAINDIDKISNLDLFPNIDLNENLVSPTSIDNFKKEREKGIKINYLYKMRKEYLKLVKENDTINGEISNLKNNTKNPDISEISNKNKKILEDLIKIRKEHKIIIEQNNENKLKMKKFLELEETKTKKNFFILQLQESLKLCKCLNVKFEYELGLMKDKLKSLELENKNLNFQYGLLQDNYNQIAVNKENIEKKYELLELEKNKNLILYNTTGRTNENTFSKEDVKGGNSYNKNSNDENNNLINVCETTYILIKNFEALNLTKEDFLTIIIRPILNEITNEKQIEKDLLVNLINKKICEYLNCSENENDVLNINNLISSMLTESENELSKFIENFLHIFDSIKLYKNISPDIEENIIKNIKIILSKYKEYFRESYDKECISFFEFRGLLENKEIIFDDDSIEYLIYRMKKDSKNIVFRNNRKLNNEKKGLSDEREKKEQNKISEEGETSQSKVNVNENDKKYSIYDLCYKTLLNIIH